MRYLAHKLFWDRMVRWNWNHRQWTPTFRFAHWIIWRYRQDQIKDFYKKVLDG